MRRWLASATIALGLAAVTTIPAAAKDTYALFGPLEVQILGAGGDIRQFTAMSSDDRIAATMLVAQLDHAIQGEGRAVGAPSTDLPHYRIGVSHLGLSYPTMPWSLVRDPSFAYYPGGDGPSYLYVEFGGRGTGLERRTIRPSPEVASMLERHLAGLSPISGSEPAAGAGDGSWGLIVGALLLAIVVAMLAEDRRRWRLHKEGAPAKGT